MVAPQYEHLCEAGWPARLLSDVAPRAVAPVMTARRPFVRGYRRGARLGYSSLVILPGRVRDSRCGFPMAAVPVAARTELASRLHQLDADGNHTQGFALGRVDLADIGELLFPRGERVDGRD